MSAVTSNVKRQLSGPTVKRLIACLFGGFVLALMVGDQEGSQTDFGISFEKATREPRLLVFLAIGLAAFFLITFSRLIVPSLQRPGAVSLGAGFLVVLFAFELMNWFDPVGKFGKLATEVGKTDGIGWLPSAYFGWLGYVLWLGCLALGLAVLVSGRRPLGYLLAAVALLGAVVTFLAHAQVVSFVSSSGGSSTDHALGVYAAVIGFAAYGVAGLVMARSDREAADPQGFVERVLSWRPGFPLAVAAVLLMIVAFFSATWFAPAYSDLDFSQTRSGFDGTGLNSIATTYLSWIAVVLSAVTAIIALVATYLRSRPLGAVTLVLGLLGLFLTFFSLEKMSRTGSNTVPQFGKLWQNLGNGGWVVCIAFGLLAGAGALCGPRPTLRRAARADGGIATLPVHAAVASAGRSSLGRTIIPIAIVMCLFYPPTLTDTWQNVLVTQIGVYVLLAVGLNVVIGWAGLLDLGYIAFYAIGSYATAYITGSLPIKPPSLLHLSPLWAIPFAIAACLVAGVLLGAPTLRLRGDYLAIVTLGFGEIIQLLAINLTGVTGGPIGPNVPNPVLDLGVFHIHWGLDNLPYWYLLLVLIVVMVIFFFRLENSRVGRAWAAIREDEVAAQATGINTARAKLLAFAIGASTSGLAGVFFASQVGYFDPSEITLQNSILIVAYVVFGGMGSLPGTIAGAAVLTWLPQFLKSQVPLADRQMWIGVIVLLMMIFRPAGLIPARRRAAELHGHGLYDADSAETRAVPVSEGL